MCKEHGRLTQGYGEKYSPDYIKGANTMRSLNLDGISKIPHNRVVTYAQIVVDYRGKKNIPAA
jgi:hypothetical protein